MGSFLEEKFFFHWSESESAFNAEMWSSGYAKLCEEIGEPVCDTFMLVEGRHVSSYISEDLERASEEYSRKAYRHPSFRQKFLSKSAERRKNFHDFFKRISKTDLGHASNGQLAEMIEEYYNLDRQLGILFYFSQAEFTHGPHEELKKRLEEYFPKEEIPQVLAILLASGDFDVVKREEHALLKMALEGWDRQKLEKHASDYAILFYNSYNKETNLAFLEKRIKRHHKLGKSEVEKSLREISDSVAEIKEKQKKLLDKIKDGQTVQLALLLRDLGFDRFELKDAWAGAEYRFLSLFQEIARRIGVQFRDFVNVYRFQDVAAALKEGVLLSKEETERRKDFYVFYLKGGAFHFASGEEAKNLAKKTVPHYFQEKTGKEMKGVIASPGVARGKARVLKVIGVEELMKDLEEFQEGEVLVTSMTQPNMVMIAER